MEGRRRKRPLSPLWAPLRLVPTLPGVSTRRLIAAALVCGLAILVAFTVQIVVVAR